jgi:hypothetical protein
MQICNVQHVSLSLDGSCLPLAVCHQGLHLLTRKHGCWFSVCVCGWRGGGNGCLIQNAGQGEFIVVLMLGP